MFTLSDSDGSLWRSDILLLLHCVTLIIMILLLLLLLSLIWMMHGDGYLRMSTSKLSLCAMVRKMRSRLTGFFFSKNSSCTKSEKEEIFFSNGCRPNQ